MANKKDIILAELGVSRPQVVCLSETALFEHEICNYSILGYSLVSYHCRNDSLNRGGGTAIYATQAQTFTPLRLATKPVDKIIEFSGVVFKAKGQDYVVLCVYRPPRALVSQLDLFFDVLELALSEIENAYPEASYLVVGDLNICTERLSSNRERLLSFCGSHNLHVALTDPTRVTSATQSSIDVILTNIPSTGYVTETHKNCLSDHYGISLCLKHVNGVQEPTYQIKHDVTSRGRHAFSMFLQNADWGRVLGCNDANECYRELSSIVCGSYYTAFPYKLKLVKQWKPPCGVVSAATVDMRDTVSFLHGIYQTTGLEQDKINFSEANEQYKRALLTEKSTAYSSYINNSKSKSKACWQLINSEKNAVVNGREAIVLSGHSLPQQTPIVFNDFFISKPLGIMDQTKGIIEGKNISHSVTVPDSGFSGSFFLRAVGMEEVRRAIMNLNPSEAIGPDCTSNNTLKANVDIFLAPIMHLTNLSFSSGIFPNGLKIARVVPLHKKGDRTDVNMYRPLALCSAISKVMERLFYNQMYKFLVTHNVLSDHQYGFQEGKCTSNALIDSINTVLCSYDLKKCTLGCYLDLSAAFDCVNHDLLLTKLSSVGIRGVPLGWVESFLKGRQQFVEVAGEVKRSNVTMVNGGHVMQNLLRDWPRGVILGDFKSTPKEVLAGVPQGSVMGPPLYLLYVNSILKLDNWTSPSVSTVDQMRCSMTTDIESITMYADDTSLVTCAQTAAQAVANCNRSIETLRDAFAAHCLKLNVSKTGLIKYKNSDCEGTLQIRVGEEVIMPEKICKFLGVTLDADLTWAPHVSNLVKKLNSSIFIVKRFSRLGSSQLALLAYYATFESHVSYGIEVWGGGNLSHLNTILILQKKVIRLILKIPAAESCRSGFKKLGLLTSPSLYVLKILLYAKTLYDGGKLKSQSEYCNFRYTTRGGAQIVTPYRRTKAYEHAPCLAAIEYFNITKNEIRELPKMRYKKVLTSFFKNNVYYTLDEAREGLGTLFIS